MTASSTTTTISNIPFYHSLHSKYISTLPKTLAHPESYEGAMSSHLRLNGIYWALAALSLLHTPSEVKSLLQLSHDDADEKNTSITSFVLKCYNKKTGGFSGNIGHDTHLLFTLSAVQILAITDELHLLEETKENIVQFISSLQQDDGSFAGDLNSGEIDTRFSYCAVSALSILHSLDRINVDKAADYIISCQNDLDGGFGVIPGGESHAGQIFCCIGALAILGRLYNGSSTTTITSLADRKNIDLLCWWISERQCDGGGLNGRPEKQSDVCYSWWILSSLSILGRMDWISQEKLISFILKCQDDEDGGFGDRPQNMSDIFHTFFGISGLSLMGNLTDHPNGGNYRAIDPLYALPVDVVQRLKLQGQIIVHGNKDVDSKNNFSCDEYDIVYI